MKDGITIQVIRKIEKQDKTVREALDMAKKFKILTYPEVSAILEKRLSNITGRKVYE